MVNCNPDDVPNPPTVRVKKGKNSKLNQMLAVEHFKNQFMKKHQPMLSAKRVNYELYKDDVKQPKKSKKDMLPALMQNKIDGNAASSSIMSPKTMQQLNFRREGQYNLPSTFSPRSPPMSHS